MNIGKPQPPSRPQLYRLPHKALRARLFESATRLARVDHRVAGEALAALDHMAATMALIHEHGRIEDQVIHPCLAARVPEIAQALEHDHRRLDDAVALLGRAIQPVEAAGDGPSREAAGHRLYLAFSDFVGHYLVHMSLEELHGQHALESSMTDEELWQLQARARAALPPPQMATWLQITLPALSLPECLALLAQIKASAPPAVFEGALEIARKVLPMEHMHRVEVTVAR
jgi:hypothetical protein